MFAVFCAWGRYDQAHFKLRKSHLLTVVKKRWTEGATGERKARVDGLFKELTTELNKL